MTVSRGKGPTRVRIARSTGRPARKAVNGVNRAQKLLRRLSEEQARDFLRINEADVEVLDKIASGRPPRNAAAIIRGIELKLSYTLSKPKQVIENQVVEADTNEVTDAEWEAMSRLTHEVRGA